MTKNTIVTGFELNKNTIVTGFELIKKYHRYRFRFDKKIP